MKVRSIPAAATLAAIAIMVGCEPSATPPAAVALPVAASSSAPALEKSPDAASSAEPEESPQAESSGIDATETTQAGSKPALLPPGPDPADFPHLHNLLRVTDRLYSGSEPHGEAAFEDLAKLGIKTVVSVDGAKPDVEAAERHGMRYIHIPFGYDAVTPEAGKSLARAMREVEGPIYIHCHHGTHRGPAGAAIACVVEGAATGEEALAVLRKAGTSEGYAGLWRDVKAYVPPGPDEELPELVSVAEVGSLAAAMAMVDRASDNLKLVKAANWRTPPDHPDVEPAQEALLLKEGLRETVRQLETENPYDERFLAWMQEAETTAAKLEADLAAEDATAAEATFATLQGQCKRCHEANRN